MNVTQYLAERHVHFGAMKHHPTFNAQRMAEDLHVPGDGVAKAVLLKAGADCVLAVVPATHAVDLPKVERMLGCEHVELANEDEVAARFPDCETGAMPPFGSQYGMQTLVDDCLTQREEFVFQGNTHDEAITIRSRDFVNVEHPRIGSFSRHC